MACAQIFCLFPGTCRTLLTYHDVHCNLLGQVTADFANDGTVVAIVFHVPMLA